MRSKETAGLSSETLQELSAQQFRRLGYSAERVAWVMTPNDPSPPSLPLDGPGFLEHGERVLSDYRRVIHEVAVWTSTDPGIVPFDRIGSPHTPQNRPAVIVRFQEGLQLLQERPAAERAYLLL